MTAVTQVAIPFFLLMVINAGAQAATVAQIVSGNGEKVVAIALLRDELFVTREGDDHVSVYDATSLHLSRRISVPGLGRWASGLAVCPFNNFLYVSDYYTSCVHRVDLATNTVTRLTPQGQRGPLGLSVNRQHNLLVTFNRSIHEYTPTGTQVRQVSHDNNLWQAVETRQSTWMVTRSAPLHGVAELALDGRVVQSYGHQPGSGRDQMNNPRALALNSDGHVLVADQLNHRVQVGRILYQATDVRSLELPNSIPLNKPLALCYDEPRGRLYVGEAGGQKRLLAFDHVTNLDGMFWTIC